MPSSRRRASTSMAPTLAAPRLSGKPPRLVGVRVATWNVNSIRSRADRVAAFLQRQDVDVLALQETKCRDDQFPSMVFDALGYETAHVGFSQWNGVAILSRVGITDVEIGFPGQPCWAEDSETEARALGATCGGVRIWSLYVPNGRTLSDPHYTYKLDWLPALRTTAAGWLADDPAAQGALVGDSNIAPENDDVWDTTGFSHSTHASPPARAALRAIAHAGPVPRSAPPPHVSPPARPASRPRVDPGSAGADRPHAPGPGVQPCCARTRSGFPRREGMRIDSVLGSPALAARTTNALIDREE